VVTAGALPQGNNSPFGVQVFAILPMDSAIASPSLLNPAKNHAKMAIFTQFE
jgi:hypothetical protein